MIDTFRGVLRVRKWPAKYGKPRSALQAWWVDWFKQANLLAKYADPMSQARAIEMTKGSGMYPRDVLLKAMRGRLYFWSTPDGWKWYSVAAIQDVSDSLDALAQVVGSVLVRATDRWRSVVPGAIGQVLTYQGAAAAPIWAGAGGGAGVEQAELAGSPIVPDGTKSEYIFDVTDLAEITVTWLALGFASSAGLLMRFSVDGGVTYKSTVGDYQHQSMTPTAASAATSSAFVAFASPGTTGHAGTFNMTGIQTSRASYVANTNRAGSSGALRTGFTNFAGPITHLKLIATPVVNFNAGTIKLIGTTKA